jgi:hypothetical protein
LALRHIANLGRHPAVNAFFAETRRLQVAALGFLLCVVLRDGVIRCGPILRDGIVALCLPASRF